MKSYEITYSTAAGGTIVIEADTEDDAIDEFDAIDFDELFVYKDLLKGVEIDDVKEV
jgi:hypothetical protein